MSSGSRIPKGSQISEGMNVKSVVRIDDDDLVLRHRAACAVQRRGQPGEARSDDDDTLSGHRGLLPGEYEHRWWPPRRCDASVGLRGPAAGLPRRARRFALWRPRSRLPGSLARSGGVGEVPTIFSPPGPVTSTDGVPVKPALRRALRLGDDRVPLRIGARGVPGVDVLDAGRLGDAREELVGHVAGVLDPLVRIEDLDELPVATLLGGSEARPWPRRSTRRR